MNLENYDVLVYQVAGEFGLQVKAIEREDAGITAHLLLNDNEATMTLSYEAIKNSNETEILSQLRSYMRDVPKEKPYIFLSKQPEQDMAKLLDKMIQEMQEIAKSEQVNWKEKIEKWVEVLQMAKSVLLNKRA